MVGVRDATTSKKVQQRPARVDEFDKTCKSRRGVSMPVALECGEGAVKTNHNCNGNLPHINCFFNLGKIKTRFIVDDTKYHMQFPQRR